MIRRILVSVGGAALMIVRRLSRYDVACVKYTASHGRRSRVLKRWIDVQTGGGSTGSSHRANAFGRGCGRSAVLVLAIVVAACGNGNGGGPDTRNGRSLQREISQESPGSVDRL